MKPSMSQVSWKTVSMTWQGRSDHATLARSQLATMA
jgi:hypothetical protein